MSLVIFIQIYYGKYMYKIQHNPYARKSNYFQMSIKILLNIKKLMSQVDNNYPIYIYIYSNVLVWNCFFLFNYVACILIL
jgi:hypothetical protein